jgi:hypothetical protein
LSDEIAEFVIWFCRTGADEESIPLGRGHMAEILQEVERRLDKFQRSGKKPIRISKEASTRDFLLAIRPRKQSDEDYWFALQVEWVAKIIWAKAPEEPIWSAAIKKIWRYVEQPRWAGKTCKDLVEEAAARKADLEKVQIGARSIQVVQPLACLGKGGTIRLKGNPFA